VVQKLTLLLLHGLLRALDHFQLVILQVYLTAAHETSTDYLVKGYLDECHNTRLDRIQEEVGQQLVPHNGVPECIDVRWVGLGEVAHFILHCIPHYVFDDAELPVVPGKHGNQRHVDVGCHGGILDLVGESD